MWAFYSLVFVQFLFLSPFLESAIFPSFRRRLHKIRIRKKRNGRREQHLERSEENKSLVSLVLYVLRAALRILIYAFPLSSVPSFSTFLPAFSERTWPRQRKKEKKRRGSFSLFLSAWLISLQVSRAVYRAQSSVNYYGPEGGLLLIGLLTSCLLLSRRRFFFLSSLPCSLRFEERPEKLQGSVVTWPSLLASFSGIKRLQVGFGWSISYKIASSPFRFNYLPSSRWLFFFSSLSERRTNLLLGEKRNKERVRQQEYIKNLEFNRDRDI